MQTFFPSILSHAGTPITRIPIMAKQPLDMYRLFKLVVERGGLVEVNINTAHAIRSALLFWFGFGSIKKR